MLRKYRYGFVVFIFSGILITLFPPMTYLAQRTVAASSRFYSIDQNPPGGITAVTEKYNVGFLFLFDYYSTGHSYLARNPNGDLQRYPDVGLQSHLYVNDSLIAYEYLLAALSGVAVELILSFFRAKEQ